MWLLSTGVCAVLHSLESNLHCSVLVWHGPCTHSSFQTLRSGAKHKKWPSIISTMVAPALQELEGLQQGMRRLQERVAQQDASLKQHEKRVLDAVHVSERCWVAAA